MKPKAGITFVGAGALASGMAVALHEAGYPIREILVRRKTPYATALAQRVGACVGRLDQEITADIVWIAVSDEAISTCAQQLAERGNWKSKIALHSSGALASRELAALKKAGAAIASVHPMMSFVASSTNINLSGVYFAAEGDAKAVTTAKSIVTALGGKFISLQSSRKALYHAFGSMIAPLIVSELAAAEAVAQKAGIAPKDARAIMRPIVTKVIENYLQHGADKALSGPLQRGDAGTVSLHVDALSKTPEWGVYRELSMYALGKLAVKNGKALKKAVSAITYRQLK